MIKVLIITDKKDPHGRIVAKALTQKGALPLIWSSKDFLLNQKSNIHINNNENLSCALNEFPNIDLTEVDVVWFRRPGIPTVPDSAHPNDRELIRVENLLHMRSLWLNIGTSAVWVNPLSSYNRANSKVCQLREAVKIGMIIPETLVSNDRKAIVEFISRNLEQGTIYKQFAPYSWTEEGEKFNAYTCKVSAEILPEQETLQWTPGIYQKRVEKAYEVRATFFGKQCIAVKIHNADGIDWRPPEVLKNLKMTPFALPDMIYQQCLDLMQALGIVFGCFDFIVTPNSEYVFLEINEQGQFLWIEERLPELKMLDTFCNFLIASARCKGTIKANNTAISMKDILASKLTEN